jgi:hypothetical protein
LGSKVVMKNTFLSSMMFVLMETLEIARNKKRHHANPKCDIM